MKSSAGFDVSVEDGSSAENVSLMRSRVGSGTVVVRRYEACNRCSGCVGIAAVVLAILNIILTGSVIALLQRVAAATLTSPTTFSNSACVNLCSPVCATTGSACFTGCYTACNATATATFARPAVLGSWLEPNAIQHVGVTTSNLTRSVRFYTQIMGGVEVCTCPVLSMCLGKSALLAVRVMGSLFAERRYTQRISLVCWMDGVRCSPSPMVARTVGSVCRWRWLERRRRVSAADAVRAHGGIDDCSVGGQPVVCWSGDVVGSIRQLWVDGGACVRACARDRHTESRHTCLLLAARRPRPMGRSCPHTISVLFSRD